MNQQSNHLIQSLRQALLAWVEKSVCLTRHFQFPARPADRCVGQTARQVQVNGRVAPGARTLRTRARLTMARWVRRDAPVLIEASISLPSASDRSRVIALVRAGRGRRARVLAILRRKQVAPRHAVARKRQFLHGLFQGHFNATTPGDVPKIISIPVLDPVPPVVFAVEIKYSNRIRFVSRLRDIGLASIQLAADAPRHLLSSPETKTAPNPQSEGSSFTAANRAAESGRAPIGGAQSCV